MTDPAPFASHAFDNPGGADVSGRAKKPVTPRHAASILVWREGPYGPELLMGRRNKALRFMPNVMVFPGGRVDPLDAAMPAVSELRAPVLAALSRVGTQRLARACAVAAIRELHEETGLVLGELQGAAVAPNLAALDYLCRAVTPNTRPMRFNARFLMAPADAVHGTITSSGELEELGYYSMAAARTGQMASITEMILREFLGWYALDVAQRATRPLVRFLGMNSRLAER